MAELASLTVPGLYVIINHNTKSVYVGLSNNVLKAIAVHIDDIKKNVHDYIKLYDLKDCEFKLLEEVKDVRARKLKYLQYVTEHVNMGYSLYRDYFPLKYKVKTTVEYIDKQYRVVVSLVNKRNEKIVVGVFGKNENSEKFIEKYYPKDLPITKVVYCKNKYTYIPKKE